MDAGVALRDDGWYLRSEITWAKRAPMPESFTDRPTSATEKVFLLTKSPKYFYDGDAVREPHEGPPTEHYGVVIAAPKKTSGDPRVKDYSDFTAGKPREYNPLGRNMRNWWLLGPEPFAAAHFATFPTELPRRAISAGCPQGGTVLDPFFGAGTAGLVADQLQRDCIGIELNPAYAEMARRRIEDDAGMFAEVAAE
jgi:DNA modification methylase